MSGPGEIRVLAGRQTDSVQVRSESSTPVHQPQLVSPCHITHHRLTPASLLFLTKYFQNILFPISH